MSSVSNKHSFMLPQRINLQRYFATHTSGVSPCLINEATNSIRVHYQDQENADNTAKNQIANMFHAACITGHLETVKRLVESGDIGDDVNSELCGLHVETNGVLTPLCCAAFTGNCEIVQFLLNYGADVNRPSTGGSTPLHFAVMGDDNVSCVAALLSAGSDPNAIDVNGRMPLHIAVLNNDGNDVTEYMSILLEDRRTDVNAQDSRGYTALHLCAMNGNPKYTGILLACGCDVTVKTSEGTTALSMLARKMPEAMNFLVERLDSGVTLQSHDPADANCELKIDFSVLIPTRALRKIKGLSFGRENKVLKDEEEKFDGNRRSKETTLLTGLIATGNKKLLLHPLSEAFLHLKWHRVRKFFLASLFFQMILVALFTVFVIEVYLVRCPYTRSLRKNDTSSLAEIHNILKRSPYPYPDSSDGGFHWFNLKPLKKRRKQVFQENVGMSMEDSFQQLSSTVPPEHIKNMLKENCRLNLALEIIRILLIILVLMLSLQEIFQFIHKPSKYVVSGVNWVQWLLVVSVLITVWTKPKGITDSREFQLEYWQYPGAACGILIAWALMLFQVGRFPAFGVHMEMLGKVAANFGLFILAYACLLIAFALSFCVLFPEHPPFSSVPLSILKVFTMMVGEVDYEELFYNEERSQDPIIFPLTTHLLFGAFVLIMTIVLMNLLVGLAVSDIHGLQKGARLDRLCRQTALIARYESFIFSRKLETVIPTSVIRFVQESSLLTPRSHNSLSPADSNEPNDLSLCFRPNDKNDRSLPKNIKQAAVNLVASASRRQHFSTDTKWTASPSKYFKSSENQQRRKRTSLYSQRYIHQSNGHRSQIGYSTSAPNPTGDQSGRHYDYGGYPTERLNQMEAKLVVLEKGMEKILEIMTTAKKDDQIERISRV